MSTTGRCFCKAIEFAYEGEPNWTLKKWRTNAQPVRRGPRK